MKKIALILICCLVLIGCKNKDNNDNKFYRQYKEYENKIDNHNEFLNATNEFNIRLVVNKVEDKKYRYGGIPGKIIPRQQGVKYQGSSPTQYNH